MSAARTREAADQALNAWLKFREASPDFYFPTGSDVDASWSDLDTALTELDEAIADWEREQGASDG